MTVGCNHGTDNMGKRILSAIWDMLPAVVAAYNTGQAINFAMKQHHFLLRRHMLEFPNP